MDEDSNGAMGQLSAHLDRGWDLVARGDLRGAMISAQKSLELDDTSPDAHHLIGTIYQAEGRVDAALEHYRSAIDLDESFVDAMLNAADILVHPLRDLDSALTLVRDALDYLEEDETDARADAMLLEIDIHLLRQDQEAARKVVRSLPEGPYENPATKLQVGRAKLDVGDIEGAETLISEAALSDPPSADAMYYLAFVREAKKDHAGALVAFLSARELDMMMPPPPWALPPQQFEGRVRAALDQLPPELTAILEGALVVVTDLPGAEVVAEGIDPRQPLLLDELSEPSQPPRVGRVFVYKRNIERLAPGLMELDNEIARTLRTELLATFAQLTVPEATPPAADPA